jgi:hypothetical protein
VRCPGERRGPGVSGCFGRQGARVVPERGGSRRVRAPHGSHISHPWLRLPRPPLPSSRAFPLYCALADELAGRRHHRPSAKIPHRSDPSSSSPLASRRFWCYLQGLSIRIVAVRSSSSLYGILSPAASPCVSLSLITILLRVPGMVAFHWQRASLALCCLITFLFSCVW